MMKRSIEEYVQQEVERLREGDLKVPTIVITGSAEVPTAALKNMGWQVLVEKEREIGIAPSISLDSESCVEAAMIRGITGYLDYCGFEYADKTAVLIKEDGVEMTRTLLDKGMATFTYNNELSEDTLNHVLMFSDLVISMSDRPHLFKREQCPFAVVVSLGSFDEEVSYYNWSISKEEVRQLTNLGLIKICAEAAV